MKSKSYIRLLNINNRVRNSFKIHQGKIINFVVQYETRINNEWKAVVRYDTSHGFAHKDLLYPSRRKQKIILGSINYNEVLTEELKK
jgi:hypothetical protein